MSSRTPTQQSSAYNNYGYLLAAQQREINTYTTGTKDFVDQVGMQLDKWINTLSGSNQVQEVLNMERIKALNTYRLKMPDTFKTMIDCGKSFSTITNIDEKLAKIDQLSLNV